MAVHVGGNWNSEQVENGRGDVEQVGLARRRPLAERSARGNQDPFHAVIAGRAERRGNDLVRREIVQPDCPVAPVVENHREVGGEVRMGSVVQVLPLVNVLDQRPSGLGVNDLQQAGLEVASQCPGIRGLHASLGLPPLEVDEDLAEVTLCIGPCPRPVDVSPGQEN